MLTGFFPNKKTSVRSNLNEWVNAVNSDGRFGKWGWQSHSEHPTLKTN